MWNDLLERWDSLVLTFLVALYMTLGAVLAVTLLLIYFPAALS